MHPFNLDTKISRIVGVFLCSIIIVQLVGCSHKRAYKNAPSTKAIAHPWTDTIIGPWYVRIHAPEPGENPGIWEGPVEIGEKPGTFLCVVDTSLIRGIRLGPQKNILIIEAFSGSHVFDVTVTVDSCNADRNKTLSSQGAEKRDWTDTIVGAWHLRLHGPAPITGDEHPCWLGPVEIGNKTGRYFCKTNIELIDSIWVGSENNILFFRGHSGSTNFTYIVNANSCSTTIQKNPTSGSE